MEGNPVKKSSPNMARNNFDPVSVNPACPQTLLNSSRERPPDLLSDHTITAANQSSNDSTSSSSNNVYRGHAAAAAGIGRSGGESKPGSEHSSAAGSYRMAMENIIDEYSRCQFVQTTVTN